MKRNRNRSGLARERWIMAAGSVLVLGALTLTGVYVRNLSSQNYDGYIVDLTALDEKNSGLAQKDTFPDAVPDGGFTVIDHLLPSDDLDYDPFYQETSGSRVGNPDSAVNLPNDIKEQIGGPDPNNLVVSGITSSDLEIGELVMATEDKPDITPDGNIPAEGNNSAARAEELREETRQPANAAAEDKPATVKKEEPAASSVPAISTTMQTALTFKDGDNLAWPVVGNVLINYSMDKSVYFPTLKQYKYNPAIIIQAKEGDVIFAAAAGKVTKVYQDPQIGDAITIELGNGYELTYGQLKNILVSEGSFVAAGDIVAEVAAPTKYYSVEGTNVYFKLTKDGVPVNPLSKLN